MNSISPCRHPRCRNEHGDPRLTVQIICEPCRTHLARQLGWLREDYIKLKTEMPKPQAIAGNKITTTMAEPGHPAEWASDQARLIATELHRLETLARAYLNDKPSFNPHNAREAKLMESGYRYLTTRLHQTIDSSPDVAADLAYTIHTIHGQIRRSLGYTRQIQRLPGARCPHCEVTALIKDVGQVTCENCAATWVETDFDRLALILTDDALDRMIDAYDTNHDTPDTPLLA